MHDGMPYGRIQGQGKGHSREVDRQSPTGLILFYQSNSTNFMAEMTSNFPSVVRLGTGHVSNKYVTGWL